MEIIIVTQQYLDIPVVDQSGLVVSPQSTCGFSDPSATLIMHAWYANKLDGVWQKLARLTLYVHNKSGAGIHLLSGVILNSLCVQSCILKELFNKWCSNKYSPPKKVCILWAFGNRIKSKNNCFIIDSKNFKNHKSKIYG